MIEVGARDRQQRAVRGGDLRAWPTSTRWPPAARSTSWCPTPPCSGFPATSTCCRTWSATVPPGGWFAFQVPGNFDEPSHTIRARPRRRAAVRRAHRRRGRPRRPRRGHLPRALTAPRLHASTPGRRPTCTCSTVADPVFTWVSGTGARPTLQALDADPQLRRAFEAEFKARLRAAYPDTGHGVVLPFRRVFVVAQVAA